MSKLDVFRRILRLRKEQLGNLNETGRRLLDRAGFAVYIDCLDSGQGWEAMQVLKEYRQ